MRGAGVDLIFLDRSSTAFSAGVVLTAAHAAMGLEFNAVSMPQADLGNYASGMDNSMLCIARARVMHELTLTNSGTLSPFLAFARAAAPA